MPHDASLSASNATRDPASVVGALDQSRTRDNTAPSNSTVALRRQDLALLAVELLLRQHPSIAHALQSFKLFYWVGGRWDLFLRAGGLRIRIGRAHPHRAILLPILLPEQSHAPTVANESGGASSSRLTERLSDGSGLDSAISSRRRSGRCRRSPLSWT